MSRCRVEKRGAGVREMTGSSKRAGRGSPLAKIQRCCIRIHDLVNAPLQDRRYWFLAVAAILALQIALILKHEPWLDEIQALQLAVEAPDLATLLAWLRYEGHPPLFYVLVRSLAHLVEPLAVLPVLAALLAALTQTALLFRSPFTRAEKVFIASSTFFLFDFLTLSRSLALGVTCVVLAMAFKRSRWSWLAIAALPMCDFLFGVLSFALVALRIKANDRFWPGLLLWLASGMLATYFVLPPADMLPALETINPWYGTILYLLGIGTLALPFQGGVLVQWNIPALPLAILTWIPFLALCLSVTRSNPLHRWLLLAFVTFTFLFSLFVYPLAIRHLMLIALLIVVLTWEARESGEAARQGLRVWLLVAACCGMATAAINLMKPFDTAEQAAAAINRMGLAKSHWMVWPDSRAQVVAAYLGIDFERTERHCMQSAIRWNFRTKLITLPMLYRYLAAEVGRHGRFYLLSDRRLKDYPRDLVEPIKSVPAGYDGQEYHLYTIGPRAPAQPVDLPPCIPGRRPLAKL